MLSKGFLVQGMFQTQLPKSFVDDKEKMGFCILSLIPPIKGCGDKPKDSSLCNTELLLGEASENLKQVDTTININTTILPQAGLFVCTNIVLLYHAFAQVQSTTTAADDNHPTPSLFSAAIKLGDNITSQPLQDNLGKQQTNHACLAHGPCMS